MILSYGLRGLRDPSILKEEETENDEDDEDDEDEDCSVQDPWDSDDEHVFSQEPGMEWYEASAGMILAVIGVGIMAQPFLPTKGGWVMTIVGALVCLMAINESAMALWKGIMAGNKNSHGNDVVIISYEDFGRAAWGEKGEAVVMVSMVLYFIGICTSFMAVISQSLAHLLPFWDDKQWLLAASPGMAALAFLPNVTAVAKLAHYAVIVIFILVQVIVIKSLLDAQRWQAWPDLDMSFEQKVWPDTPMAMATVLPSLFGASAVTANVPSILCEMKDPMDFPKALKAAMLFIGTCYLAVMCTAYYGYGQFMQPDIVDSMSSFPSTQAEAFLSPFDEWTGPKANALKGACSALLVVKLIIGLPLNFIVVFYSFQTYRYTKAWVTPGSFGNKVLRLAVVGAALFLAVAVKNFNQLYSLMTALSCPLLQCVMPMFFSYMVRKQNGARRSSFPRRIYHAFIVILALFCLTVGSWESLQVILRSE